MLDSLYLGAIRFAQGSADFIPDGAGTAPGTDMLNELIDNVRTWALIACVLAIIVAAILWAWGSQSQNAAQATQGKKGMLIAIAAAAVVVAAKPLVEWGMKLGGSF